MALISGQIGGRGDCGALSAVVSLVDIGDEVYVVDIPVQNFSRSVNHSWTLVGAYSHCMSKHIKKTKSEGRLGARGETRTNAMPRIRIIFPGSTKLSVFTCFTIGQMNSTSPPPSGTAPRFLICVAIRINGVRQWFKKAHLEFYTVFDTKQAEVRESYCAY